MLERCYWRTRASHRTTGECNDPFHNQLLNVVCRQCLKEVVEELHCVGLHHHDLQFRNVVRGDGDALSVIDFETVIKVDPSIGCQYKLCPDDAWLEEVKPYSTL